MTFTTLAELRAYILATFTANGVRDITGPEAKDTFIGILDLIAPALLADLDVNVGAGKVGGAHNGDHIVVGTTFDALLRKILREAIPPTYVAPTTALSSSITTLEQEIGTILSPIFNLSYTQNDGGALVSRSLTRNGSGIATSFPYTDASVVLDASKAYQGFASYAQGACKNDSLGAQDCTSRINSGNASSNIITYLPYRKAFYGTPVSAITTSANVRAMSDGFLNPANGSVFTIAIPAGSLRVVFAYPATLEDVASVKFVEMGGTEIKGAFVKTTVSVEGASSFTAINYKVFTFVPVEAFTTAATYQVTI